jgi:hypothetical protein
MEENNNKPLTKTDSLIYNFLEETNDETVSENKLLKKKSSIEEFLVWLDSNLDELSITTEIDEQSQLLSDSNSIKSIENSDEKNRIKFEDILKNSSKYLTNMMSQNEKISTFSNDLYKKCQNTAKNVKPVFQNFYSSFKYELNEFNNNSNTLNSSFLNRFKKASDNLVISFTNLRNTYENRKSSGTVKINTV